MKRFALVFLVAASCVTTAKVKEINALSNAAIVAPYLPVPGGAGDDDAWQEALAKIDRLIAEHPDEAVLVNHLRVRQAVLLTTNGQPGLARAKWAEVQGDVLAGNSRDRTLFDVREPLLWAFAMLPGGRLNSEEMRTADAHAASLRAAAGGAPVDLADYFHTVAALIALKRANAMPQNDQEQILAIKVRLDSELARYLADIGVAAARWADDTPDNRKATLAAATALGELRAGVSAVALIARYEQLAIDLDTALAVRWTLDVTVTRGGAPVEGAVVTIESPRHAPHRTETDEDGKAEITSHFAGTVTVRAGDAFTVVEMAHGATEAISLGLR